MRKIGKNYNLQPCLLKQELEHDETYEDYWEEKGKGWLPYLRKDVLSTAFSYATYSKGMEEVTGSGMKNSLTLPITANKFFNSLRNENDEPIYTYNDKYMRFSVRQNLEGGRCGSFN